MEKLISYFTHMFASRRDSDYEDYIRIEYKKSYPFMKQGFASKDSITPFLPM